MRVRVDAVAAADAGRKVCGASSHRFVLHQVLTVAELADLEQAIGVRLPEEYRVFLLEVGNGGAGPDYGIERVERASGGWRWTGHGTTIVGKLRVPFQPSGPQVYAKYDTNQPVEGDFPDHGSFLAAARAWRRRQDDLYDEDAFGSITLSHQGCGYYWLLVVSGSERGTIWEDCRAVDMPLSPLVGPGGERLTFGRWYLDWLAKAEEAVAAADST